MINSTKTTLRPINIAFIVDYDDKKALSEVIRTNSYLWGGAYNCIIPAYKRIPSSLKQDYFSLTSLDIVKRYLTNYDPDFIVNLSSIDDKKIENRDRNWRMVSVADILGKYEANGMPGIGIGLREILSHIEETEFKYVRKNEVSILDVEIPKRYDLFYESVFGAVEPGVWSKLARRFSKNLNMKKVQVDKDSYLETLDGENWFIRRFTDYYLKRYSGDAFTSGYAMYMDANNWHDIVDYINLRATGASVLPIAKQGIEAEKNLEYLKSYLKANTRASKHNKDIVYRPNILKARSVKDEDFDNFIEVLSSSYPETERPQLTIQKWYPRVWDAEDIDRNFGNDSVVEAASSRQSFSTNEALVKLVRPQFEADAFDTKYRFVNDISFDVIGANEYYAEVLADTERLASHVLGGVGYANWRISKRGIVYVASGWAGEDKTVRLRVPKGDAIFSSWYKSQTNKDIELSTPGKVARQMLKKLGGPDRVRTIANEDLLKLFQKTVGDGGSMPTLTYKKLRGELNGIIKRDEPLWDAEGLIGRLLDIGAIELGSQVQCPHCSKHNWYPLNKLDVVLTCAKCLDDFDVAKESPDRSLVWSYSLAGPFRLPNMADGAYTTLLSLYFLNDTMHFSITPHLSFTGVKDKSIEADFGLLIRDHNIHGTKVTPIIGECKSFWKQFTDIDIQRMKKMAKDLDNPILVFATLKKELDKAEKRRLLKLLDSQRKARFKNGPKSRLLILTANELFCGFGGLGSHWSKLTKKHQEFAKYIDSRRLSELCDATQQLYLDSQPESEWLDGVFKRKRETAKIKEV